MKWTILATALSSGAAAIALPHPNTSTVVNQTTCGGNSYAYTGLEGYGYVPSDALDKYGDTLGGIGSAATIDQASWKRTGPGSYSGIAWCIPDRGWYARRNPIYSNYD